MSIPAVLAGLVLSALASTPSSGCRRDPLPEIRELVDRLVKGDATEAAAAMERLNRFGRPAIPAIETALQSSKPGGRHNLLTALRRLGDEEAVPLLRHVAEHDDDDAVRSEAVSTLRAWATGSGTRGQRAAAALRHVEQARAAAESAAAMPPPR